jgi:hypothetical protein
MNVLLTIHIPSSQQSLALNYLLLETDGPPVQQRACVASILD